MFKKLSAKCLGAEAPKPLLRYRLALTVKNKY